MPNDDPSNDSLPDAKPPSLGPRRERMYEVIFGAETPAGRAFDLALLAAIMLSVLAVMLDSVAEIHDRWGRWLLAVEWFFTVLFTIEYVARLICVRRPWRYAVSFFGIVDLLAIVPTYLSVFIAGSQTLLVIRTLVRLRPGDSALRMISPAVPVAWTITWQRPLKTFRRVALSGS